MISRQNLVVGLTVCGLVGALAAYYVGGNWQSMTTDVAKTASESNASRTAASRASSSNIRELEDGARGATIRAVSSISGLPLRRRSIEFIVQSSPTQTRTVQTDDDGRFELEALGRSSGSQLVALGEHWAQQFDPKRDVERGRFATGVQTLAIHELCDVSVSAPDLDRNELLMGIAQLDASVIERPPTVVPRGALGTDRSLSRRMRTHEATLRVPHGTRLKISLKSFGNVLSSKPQQVVAPGQVLLPIVRKPALLVKFMPVPNDIRKCSVVIGELRDGRFVHVGFVAESFPVLGYMSFVPMDELPTYRTDKEMAVRILGSGKVWFGQSEPISAPKQGWDQGQLAVPVSLGAGVLVLIRGSGAGVQPWISEKGKSLVQYPTADRGDGYGLIQADPRGFVLRNLSRPVRLVMANLAACVFVPVRVTPGMDEVVVQINEPGKQVLLREGREFALGMTDGAKRPYHVMIRKRVKMFDEDLWMTCRRCTVGLPEDRKELSGDSFWSVPAAGEYRVLVLLAGQDHALTSPVLSAKEGM